MTFPLDFQLLPFVRSEDTICHLSNRVDAAISCSLPDNLERLGHVARAGLCSFAHTFFAQSLAITRTGRTSNTRMGLIEHVRKLVERLPPSSRIVVS